MENYPCSSLVNKIRTINSAFINRFIVSNTWTDKFLRGIIINITVKKQYHNKLLSMKEYNYKL